MKNQPKLSPPAGMNEELCLLAPRQLSSLIEFVEQMTLHGVGPDLGAFAEAWRAAAAVYRELALTEAGASEHPDIQPLPKSMQAHAARLIGLPAVRKTFDTVPVALGMVELDKLIVTQFTLTRAIVDRIGGAFPNPPRPRQLAELCLPLHGSNADFRLACKDGKEFTFVSDAHDMRFLAGQVLSPDNIGALAVEGHARAVVALSVGFSTNLLNVVRFNDRVALNNGHHRAYALRSLGVTHVPCVIQACGTRDELRQAATSEICDNSDLYFESPRPPLLRDFDHPALVRSIQAPRLQRQLQLKVEVQSRLMAV